MWPALTQSSDAGDGVQRAEEEGRVTIVCRSLVDKAVDLVHQLGEVAWVIEGDPAQRGAQAGHQQGCRDSFAGDVADRETQSAVLKRKDIVIIAADTLGGAAVAGDGGSGKLGHLLGKEPLLDLARDLDLAIHALALGRFMGEGMGQFADFEGHAGLSGEHL